jgi:hypothetical protein
MPNSLAMRGLESYSDVTFSTIPVPTLRVLAGRDLTSRVMPARVTGHQLRDEALKFCGRRPIYRSDASSREKERGIAEWRMADYQPREESWNSERSRMARKDGVDRRNGSSVPIAHLTIRTSEQRDESSL